jgi:hypothetical protein
MQKVPVKRVDDDLQDDLEPEYDLTKLKGGVRGKYYKQAAALEECKRKTKCTGNLADLFAASPLRGSGLQVKRVKNRPAKADL